MKTDEEITAEIKEQVHHFQPGVYAWLAVLVSSITLPILAVIITLHINQRALDNESKARQTAQAEVQRERETNRRGTCLLVIAQDQANNDPTLPPTITERGAAAAKAWHDMRKTLRCDEGN